MNLTFINLVKYYCVKTLVLLITVVLFSSCLTQKKVEYLRSKDSHVKEFVNNTFEEYRLKPNDELFIQITSFDDVASFSGNTSQNSNLSNPFGASLQAHTIDKDGNLELPIIGKLMVKDKSIAEVKEKLKETLTNVLSQPLITVKLVNKYVSVLGEVNGPGHYPYSQETLTIFNALSMAGDLTDYANRRNIILIRNSNGKIIKKQINLQDEKILQTEFFYLQPNDMLYAKPLRVKHWNRRVGSLAMLLTVANVVLVIMNTNR